MLRFPVKKESEPKAAEKETAVINGRVVAEPGLQRHLVIRVTPPGHSRRITPCSATRLISEVVSDSGSVWNSPISVKSVASKKSLPAMNLDLITFISDPKPGKTDKYNPSIWEYMEQEKDEQENKKTSKY